MRRGRRITKSKGASPRAFNLPSASIRSSKSARAPQRRCARRARTLEKAPPRSRRASRARRRAGRRDAWPLHHLDAHPRKPEERSREAPSASGAAGSGREDLLELVGLRDLELVVAAILGGLSGRHRRKSAAWRKRSPCMWSYFTSHTRSAAAAPTTDPCPRSSGSARRHAARFGGGARPFSPRMVLHRVLAQRRKLLNKLLAHRHGEGGGDADVLQHAAVVVLPRSSEPTASLPLLCQRKPATTHSAVRACFIARLPGR